MKVEARFKYDSFLAELTAQEFTVFANALAKFRKVEYGIVREDGPNELHPAGYLDLEIRIRPDSLPVSDYVAPAEEPAAE